MTPVSEAFLLARGYLKHTASNITYPYSDFFMQKRFDDDKGKKYFIDFVHYSKVKPDAPNNEPNNHESWMAGMRQNEPKFLEFKYHYPEDIVAVEDMVEKFWVEFCGSQYYEMF